MSELAAPALSLSAINQMPRAAFVGALGATFEHSPWVAEQAWAARPFASVDALHDAMMQTVRGAARETQVAFLRAHPELAGREARAGTMTDDSTTEQASAGLHALTRAELEQIQQLNARYRAKHGFPFIIAVRRHGKAAIFAELQRRLALDTEAERHEALAQIGIITRLRLQALLGEAPASAAKQTECTA